MESFLLGLKQRHCNFHIVFIENNQECCIPRGIADVKRPRYLLARSIIRRHLMINLTRSQPHTKIKIFESMRDASFQRYLIDTGIYFVMCHDGANVDPTTSTEGSLCQADDDYGRIEKQEMSRKTRLRAMISTLINQGYNIALINGLEFMDTKVRANVTNCFSQLSAYSTTNRS